MTRNITQIAKKVTFFAGTEKYYLKAKYFTLVNLYIHCYSKCEQFVKNLKINLFMKLGSEKNDE